MIDFMLGLSENFKKWNSIWVIVDRLNKLAYFILVRVDYNATKLGKIYVKEIVRLHGVPCQLCLAGVHNHLLVVGKVLL